MKPHETKKQIFVAGTWEDHKVRSFADIGRSIGTQIANRGYDLACGPGTGMARYIIEGYRAVSHRGKVTFYLPRTEEMERVGEIVGEGSDDIIQTEYDYPMRNIYQVKLSQAVFVITGGDGTLEEAICALADYDLPVAVVKGSGKAAKALEILLNVFVSWNEKMAIDDNIDRLMDHIDKHLSNRIKS